MRRETSSLLVAEVVFQSAYSLYILDTAKVDNEKEITGFCIQYIY